MYIHVNSLCIYSAICRQTRCGKNSRDPDPVDENLIFISQPFLLLFRVALRSKVHPISRKLVTNTIGKHQHDPQLQLHISFVFVPALFWGRSRHGSAVINMNRFSYEWKASWHWKTFLMFWKLKWKNKWTQKSAGSYMFHVLKLKIIGCLATNYIHPGVQHSCDNKTLKTQPIVDLI